jgi:hypothetical protein
VTTALATKLTNADRCDRCGAQAYARVVLTSGGDLLFCGHHMRMHRDSVAPLAARIDDESDRIDDPAMPS